MKSWIPLSILLVAPHVSAQDHPPLDDVSKRAAQAHLEVPTSSKPPSRSQQFSPSFQFVSGLSTINQVNVSAGGDNIVGDAGNEPSIAIDPRDPNRLVIGWRQFDRISSNFRQAGWGYSHNGGRSWEFPDRIEAGNFRSDPILSVDEDGRFYYCSLSGDFSVQVFPSDTSGISWLPGHNAFGGDKQWLIIDRVSPLAKGHVYMSWSIAAGCCGSRIFTRSTDAGVTFSNPVTIPESPIWGTLAVDAEGLLYISGIRGDFFDTSTFVVARSSNARNPSMTPSFDQIALIDLGGSLSFGGSPNPGGLLGQAWIVADTSGGPRHGFLYLLCSVNPSGPDPMDVHFSRSEDGGLTWSHPVRVNDDSGNNWQWFGTMSVAPNGRLDVIWNDTRNDGSNDSSEVFYSSSDDGGLTWSPNEAVSPSFDNNEGYPQQDKLGDYYHMRSDDVGADVAFAATFNDEQDVYHMRIGEYDCNGNGVPDSVDISGGSSADVDFNGIPDECESLLMLGPVPGPAGGVNTIHVTKVTPGETVFFFVGTLGGSIPIGPCPGASLGMIDPIILGAFNGGVTGRITLEGFVDGSFSGLTFLLQALELSNCHLSNLVTHTF